MAWIESHQAVGQHPKTIAFAQLLGVSMPTAVGHLHYLWWWALDYAPDGELKRHSPAIIAHACQWHGKPDRFWQALVDCGFVDQKDSGESLHDWYEYGGRLADRRKKEADRKRTSRGHGAGNPEDVLPDGAPTAHAPDKPDRTNQPDQPPVGPLLATSPARARAPDVAPPRRAAGLENGRAIEPDPLRPEQKQCPLCREVLTSSYADHMADSPKHKVRPLPEDFNGRPSSSKRPPGSAEGSDGGEAGLVAAELAAMATRPTLTPADLPPELLAEHERILARERQRSAPNPEQGA